MPLSEFHRTTAREKGETTHSRMNNSSADLFSMPDHDFAELRWENGQIVMQSQSGRPRKGSLPTAISAEASKIQEKETSDAANPKVSQSVAIDSILNDLSPPVPCAHIGLNAEDDDMVPWMHYPIENSLQNDYCSEFLNEFPAFNLNSLSAHNINTAPADRSSGLNQETRNSQKAEHGQASKALTESPIPSRKARAGPLFQLSQHCQSIPSSKARVIDIGNGGSSKTQQGPCKSLVHTTRLQSHNLESPKPPQPSRDTGVMNFSHFSRPAAFAKATAQNIDRLRRADKATTPSDSNPVESSMIEPTSVLKSVNKIQGSSAPVPLKAQLQSSVKPAQEVISVEQSTAIIQGDASRKDDNINTGKGINLLDHDRSPRIRASMNLQRREPESGPEAVVAPSSVCSANGARAASNDCKQREKRKSCEVEESRYQTEDFEDESVGMKKPATGWGKSAKRSRAAEVHNLSERRRRDRINEKMRALQELIPNCNKSDKASMLEEAIEYLKTLQMQLQIMSMGSGLCMPPMMLPTGMQHMHAPAMAHYPPMGVGMGMGIGLGFGMGMCEMNGAPGRAMIPAPPMHGPPFSCPLASGPPGLHGIPGSIGPQMFVSPGHGIPVTMPPQPQFASFPGLSVNAANPLTELAGTVKEPLQAADTAPTSTSKDQQLKITNFEALQKPGISNSQNQASASQVEKEGL